MFEGPFKYTARTHTFKVEPGQGSAREVPRRGREPVLPSVPPPAPRVFPRDGGSVYHTTISTTNERSIPENGARLMSMFDPAPPPWPGRMLAVLRIVAGLVFVSFGTMKLFGFPPPPAGMPPISPISQLWIAGVLETFGGSAILLGLFTRPVALILSGEMAVAYFQGHFPQSVFPTTNMGTPAILYCFFFLYLVAAGPGAWSVDGRIARSKGSNPP